MAITDQHEYRKYDIHIDDKGYMIANPLKGYKKSSQPNFVEQQRTSSEKGEADIDWWWPHRIENWQQGEGVKKYVDNKAQFYESYGVDISEKGRIQLLFDTSKVKTAAMDVLPLTDASTHLYAGTATDQVSHTTDGSSWTDNDIDPNPHSTRRNILSLCYDGEYIYASCAGVGGAHGSDPYNGGGIHRGVPGAAAANWAHWSNLGYVDKMLYHNETIYAIESVTGPSVNNVAKLWTAASGAGSTGIKDWGTGTTSGYTELTGIAGGLSGDIFVAVKSKYQSSIWKYDGSNTTLVQALPHGFVPTDIYYYLDVLYIGGYEETSASGGGVGAIYYIATPSASAPTFGLLIRFPYGETGTASRNYEVKSFMGFKDKLYFGFNHIESDQTDAGIGVYDIANGGFSRNIATTALAASANNETLSIAYYKGKKYFGVKQSGIWGEGTTYVASGYVKSSIFTHGVAQNKLEKEAIALHEALAAGEKLAVDFTTDNWATTTSGTSNETDGSEITTTASSTGTLAKSFGTKLVLTAGTNQATTPVVTEITARGLPILTSKKLWEILIVANDYPINHYKERIDLTGRAIVDQLWTSKAKSYGLQFQDKDYGHSSTVNYCLIEDIEENPLNLPEGIPEEYETVVRVKLREV